MSQFVGAYTVGMEHDSPIVAVIENHRSVREALASLLRAVHFRVEEFASAESFLSSPQHRFAECLIVNVQLPGMSGPELHSHLVSRGRSVPTIFMTAGPRIEPCAAWTQTAFLEKPFDPDVLVGAVTALCGGPAVPARRHWS